jgi:hypothetical protein
MDPSRSLACWQLTGTSCIARGREYYGKGHPHTAPQLELCATTSSPARGVEPWMYGGGGDKKHAY